MPLARLVAILVFLALSACGGGGGGGGGDGAPAGGTGSTAGAGGATSPAGAGNPAAGTPADGGPAASAVAPLGAFGPVTLAQLGSAQASTAPAVARLPQGGLAVAWLQGDTLLLQWLDAAGNRMGGVQTVATTPLGRPLFDLAALAGGDVVVAWAVSTLRAFTPAATTITVSQQRFAPDGTPRGGPQPVDAQLYWSVSDRLVVRALADGGHAVGWTAAANRSEPARALVHRFAPGASSGGSTVRVGSANVPQGELCLAPLAAGALAVAWTQADATGAATAVTQTLDAAGRAQGNERLLAEVVTPMAGTGLGLRCAPAGGTRVVLGWRSPGLRASWAVDDADGSRLSPIASTGPADDLQLVDVGSAGFARVTQFIDSNPVTARSRLGTQAFAPDGTPAGPPVALDDWLIVGLDPATGIPGPDAPRAFAVAGGPDGRLAIVRHVSTPGGVVLQVLAR